MKALTTFIAIALLAFSTTACSQQHTYRSAVIVNNSQLVGREAHGHEVIVLFVTTVIGVLLGFLCTHQSGSGAAMMPIGNVEGGHLGKLLGNGINVLLLVYNPEGMTETTDLRDRAIWNPSDSVRHQW